MKNTKHSLKKLAAASLCLSLTTACSTSALSSLSATDLTADMSFQDSDKELEQNQVEAVSNFSFLMLQKLLSDHPNALFSGISAWMVMGMLENGASGDTLDQIEEVLGLPPAEIRQTASSYFTLLKEQNSLDIADSVWIRDAFQDAVEKSFLEICASDFHAEIFATAMDEKTVTDINTWTDEHTDHLISKLVDQIDPLTQMILVNAQAFNGAWQIPFEEDQTRKDVFTSMDHTETEVDFLHGFASSYVENDTFKGFIKNYDESRYGYLVLLPKNEEQSLSDAARSLNGTSINDLLDNRISQSFEISMPKLNQSSSFSLNEALQSLGITDAFSENADFSGIAFAKEKLALSNVIQKTFIEVNETGTKAAAVTEAEINTTSAWMPEEIEPIHANRPFIYMIVDLENTLPIFCGTLNQIDSENS